eukprot:gene11292-12473_t
METTKATAFSSTAKLPPPIGGLKTFNNQVAGHLEFKSIPCFLLDKNDHVLKMVDTTKLTGITETAFFEKVFDKKADNGDFEFLKHFLPKYYGLLELDYNGEKCILLKKLLVVIPGGSLLTCIMEFTVRYIELENLLSGFAKPSIMDIKIGRTTSDPFADAGKVKREAAKYQYQTHLGFRILGYKSFRVSAGKTEFYDKAFCKKLAPDDIISNKSREQLKFGNLSKQMANVYNLSLTYGASGHLCLKFTLITCLQDVETCSAAIARSCLLYEFRLLCASKFLEGF